jgi:hypothetical protein
MPFPEHVRMTVEGTLGYANQPIFERFSYRLNFDGGGVLDAFSEAKAEDMANDTAAFFTRAASRIGTQVTFTTLKLAKINSVGKYSAAPIIVGRNVRAAGGTPSVHAPQVALAVSLVTDRRGASGRGRFYLPMPAVSLGNNATLLAEDAQGIATSAKTYLDALNNFPGVDNTAAEISVVSSKGFSSKVTGVRVGRALDTIRSRRADLLEAYGPTLDLA